MTRSLVLSCVLAALAAGHAQAQSAPPVMAPKRAAQRAAAATNSHTIAMTADQSASGSAKAASVTVREAVISRGATSDSVSGAARKAADAKPGFRRETFSYDRSGRRDPFVSLMTSGELRPLITDLRLVAIAFAPSGRGSVAVLRDLVTKDQYRVKVGQTLGRMHVSRIGSKKVLFTIEEFGFSRQQELTLGDSTQARTK
jgi:hypothetical protein